MKLIIASNNAHKVREIKEILGEFFPEILSLREAGVDIDVAEDGATFEENAVLKAETVLSACPSYDAALADDSGLMVDHLGGAPGVYSARYAGDVHDDQANNCKLMSDMEGVPEEKRGCRFCSAIALARRGRPTVTVLGTCEGTLLTQAQGSNGFGYDPYFYYEPLKKSFAQLTTEEKNAVSHRSRSLALLRQALAGEVAGK